MIEVGQKYRSRDKQGVLVLVVGKDNVNDWEVIIQFENNRTRYYMSDKEFKEFIKVGKAILVSNGIQRKSKEPEIFKPYYYNRLEAVK